MERLKRLGGCFGRRRSSCQEPEEDFDDDGDGVVVMFFTRLYAVHGWVGSTHVYTRGAGFVTLHSMTSAFNAFGVPTPMSVSYSIPLSHGCNLPKAVLWTPGMRMYSRLRFCQPDMELEAHHHLVYAHLNNIECKRAAAGGAVPCAALEAASGGRGGVSRSGGGGALFFDVKGHDDPIDQHSREILRIL